MKIRNIIIICFGVIISLLLTFGIVGMISKNQIYDQELEYTEYTLSNNEKIKIYTIDLMVNNAYLIASDNGMVLVDAGMPFLAPVISNYIDKIGRDDLNLIFITHSHIDHYGSAAELRRIYESDIGVHKNDAQSMREGNTRLGLIRNWYLVSEKILPLIEPIIAVEPTEPDVLFEGEEYLDNYGIHNTQVLHIPGHTEGHSGLVIDKNKIAFIGDIVTVNGNAEVQKSYAHNWEELKSSLYKLDGMNIQYYYVAHGNRMLQGEEFSTLIKDYH